MINDLAIDNVFNNFACDGSEGDRSVVSGIMPTVLLRVRVTCGCVRVKLQPQSYPGLVIFPNSTVNSKTKSN